MKEEEEEEEEALVVVVVEVVVIRIASANTGSSERLLFSSCFMRLAISASESGSDFAVSFAAFGAASVFCVLSDESKFTRRRSSLADTASRCSASTVESCRDIDACDVKDADAFARALSI